MESRIWKRLVSFEILSFDIIIAAHQHFWKKIEEKIEIQKQNSSVSMLLVETKAIFSKKAKGKIRFSCYEAKEAKDLVNKAISSGDGQRHWFTSIGLDENGDEVSRFQFHWSVKSKS